jgi:alpha-ketoglutarate-dependent taurine dioxygenase
MTSIKMLPYRTNTLPVNSLQQELLTHGTLILRHAENTREDFLRLTESLGHDFICQEPKGKYRTVSAAHTRQALNAERNLFSVGGTGQYHALNLHSEFYFQSTEPPRALFFYCEQASQTEGHTLICDGRALFASLGQEVQQRFLKHALIYRRYHPKARWQQQFQVSTPEALEAYFLSLQHQISWEGDTACVTFKAPSTRLRQEQHAFVNNFLPFAERQILTPSQTRARVSFSGNAVIDRELLEHVQRRADQLTRPIVWNKGDIAIIDNTRMLHGRKALDKKESRRVCLRMGNMDCLAEGFESHAEGLERVLQTSQSRPGHQDF